jgi:ubiquinone biosynthesis protein UbiJ
MLPFPFLPAPARVCAKVVNSLLRREPWVAQRLARHAGKSVRFTLGTQAVCLTIDSEGGVQPGQPEVVPDVRLHLPTDRLGQVLKVLRNGNADEVAHYLHVEGDAGLAALVSELARSLRFDFEYELANKVGDVAAHRLVGAGRSLAGGAGRAARRLGENLGEYLSEEQAVLAASRQLPALASKLQRLTETLNTLDQRVARLERRSTGVSS